MTTWARGLSEVIANALSMIQNMMNGATVNTESSGSQCRAVLNVITTLPRRLWQRLWFLSRNPVHRFGVLIWLLALYGRRGCVEALTAVIKIEPNREECFILRTQASWQSDLQRNPRFAYGYFELVSDFQQNRFSSDPLVVYLSTYDLSKTLFRSDGGRDSGHFDVPLEANQKYWFCLANVQSSAADDDVTYNNAHFDNFPRMVGFSLDVVAGNEFDYTDLGGNVVTHAFDETARAHHQAKQKSMEWQKMGSELETVLRDLRHHFDYLRVREAEHRDITEKTFTHVLTWTLIQLGAVVLVALGQILYFRRFLERKNRHSIFA